MNSMISQLELRLKALSFVRVADKGGSETNDYEAHYRYTPQLPEKLKKESYQVSNVRSSILWTVTPKIVSYGIVMNSAVDSMGSVAIVGVKVFPISSCIHSQVDKLFLEYRLFELNAVNALIDITTAFTNEDGVPISVCAGSSPPDSSKTPSNN